MGRTEFLTCRGLRAPGLGLAWQNLQREAKWRALKVHGFVRPRKCLTLPTLLRKGDVYDNNRTLLTTWLAPCNN